MTISCPKKMLSVAMSSSQATYSYIYSGITILLWALDFRPKNGQILSIIGIFGHFGPNFRLSGPLDDMPYRKKNNTNVVPRWFLIYEDTQNFDSIPLKTRFFAPKTAKFGRKLAFLAKYWPFWPQKIGFLGPFNDIPDQRKTMCLGALLVF